MPITLTQNRIQSAFDQAKQGGRAAFIGYLPAGYPSNAEYLQHAKTLLEHVDLLEVGMPYSDPLGDGPTIQKAGEKALQNGATISSMFESVKILRSSTEKPLVVMTYYNPILAWGEARFMDDCVASGVDGLILPDLPPDEADTLRPLALERNIKLTFLIAPTSTPERIEIVALACTGFVYAVSVTGVTGARATGALHEVPAMLERARMHTKLPIAVGFGVSNRESAQAVADVADGVVVGSAFINTLERGGDLGALALEIKQGTRKPS